MGTTFFFKCNYNLGITSELYVFHTKMYYFARLWLLLLANSSMALEDRRLFTLISLKFSGRLRSRFVAMPPRTPSSNMAKSVDRIQQQFLANKCYSVTRYMWQNHNLPPCFPYEMSCVARELRNPETEFRNILNYYYLFHRFQIWMSSQGQGIEKPSSKQFYSLLTLKPQHAYSYNSRMCMALITRRNIITLIGY